MAPRMSEEQAVEKLQEYCQASGVTPRTVILMGIVHHKANRKWLAKRAEAKAAKEAARAEAKAAKKSKAKK